MKEEINSNFPFFFVSFEEMLIILFCYALVNLMPIERDFDLILDHKILSSTQGKGFSRLLKKHKIAQCFQDIILKLPYLYDPQLIWDTFSVKELTQNGFLLENGFKIGGGPVKEVMKEAAEIILGICTIGPKIDVQIEEYTQSGNNLAAVILDSIASFLVDQVREKFFNQTKLNLQQERKFYSIPLCPGESEWSVSDHKIFFELLHPEQIGMSLKESMLMIPMKSLSFMVGIADEPFELSHKKRCDFCPLQSKCRYSKSELGKSLCN